MGCRRSNAAGRVLSRRFPPRTGAGSGMGAVTARRFRDEGAAVVLTGRTREKLTKVVSQFDQERSLIHVSDVTKPDEQQDVRASTAESASQAHDVYRQSS